MRFESEVAWLKSLDWAAIAVILFGLLSFFGAIWVGATIWFPATLPISLLGVVVLHVFEKRHWDEPISGPD